MSDNKEREELDEAHARNEVSRKRASDALDEMHRLGDVQAEGRRADDDRRAADDSRREADDTRRGADDVRRAADDDRRRYAHDEAMEEGNPPPEDEVIPSA